LDSDNVAAQIFGGGLDLKSQSPGCVRMSRITCLSSMKLMMRMRPWHLGQFKRHPRFHLHFIPTSSSWLNMIERWFSEITFQRIRRGSFKNVHELIAAIKQYIESHNQNPKAFVWTASVESIMRKISKCKDLLVGNRTLAIWERFLGNDI
jgi:uncharacterized protein involved in cysteine biosynthesis